MPEGTQGRTTTATATVRNADGTTQVVVASSEKNLRPAPRAALQAGERLSPELASRTNNHQRRSGNGVFVPAGPERELRKQRVTETLRRYGCMFEGMGVDKGLIAVTIPRNVNRDLVLRYLDELGSSKKAYWDSGNF